MARKKVIIVGGGFGGINAAKAFHKEDFDILLIDKTNHHLFQPLLYQVAGAVLSPGDIASPIREILDRHKNTTVIMGEVTSIDKKQKNVVLANGDVYPFDYLILAPGARHSYFGHDEWEAFAPGLKNLNDAINIRENILLAFERAERCDDPAEVQKYLRFVIIGGGPTGVEMAGAIAEIAHKALFRNFRRIKPEHSEIYVIEGTDRLLQVYPEELSKKAQGYLEKLGVIIQTHTKVTNITKDGVYIGDQFLEANNVIWAAGNQAPPMLKTLDVPLDRAGRVIVNFDMSIPDHPEIFAIGDAASATDKEGNPLPGIAPVAIQQGHYVANVIKKNITQEKRPPFHYFDKGSLATVGKAKAVGVVGKKKLSGLLAWLAWSFIHIFYLISFANRFMVMTRWFFLYLTGSRHVRLIKKPIFDTHPDNGVRKREGREKF